MNGKHNVWYGCSGELGMDWRGGPGGPVAGWDGCRPYPTGPATQMPAAMNGVVQRRQMSYNAVAGAGYGASIKQDYARAIQPKYVLSHTY